jgi:hypothetical protein
VSGAGISCKRGRGGGCAPPENTPKNVFSTHLAPPERPTHCLPGQASPRPVSAMYPSGAGCDPGGPEHFSDPIPPHPCRVRFPGQAPPTPHFLHLCSTRVHWDGWDAGPPHGRP